MELKESIAKLAQQHLLDDSYYLVEVVIKGLDTRKKVLILVDGDNGVNIDTCANLSRSLGNDLDMDELFDTPFTLEVSSPGVDHPLMLSRQYKGRVGKRLKVLLKNGEEITGALLTAQDEIISLSKEIKNGRKIETEEIELKYNEIEKSFVLISFK